MKKLTFITLSLVLWLGFISSPARALTVPERLVYEVSWSGISVGKAVHEITSDDDGGLRLAYKVRSSGWFDTFYHIDDSMESVVVKGSDPSAVGVPRVFREKTHDGKHHNDKEARFDQATLQVRTKDFLNGTDKVDPISTKTYDNLSSIFFIRSSGPTIGKPLHIDVFDCKRLWAAEVRAVRREEITTPVGKFKTVVVVTDLTAKGQKPRPGYMTVWLTDDDLRIPVKMTIKLKFGEFRAVLVEGSYWHREKGREVPNSSAPSAGPAAPAIRDAQRR